MKPAAPAPPPPPPPHSSSSQSVKKQLVDSLRQQQRQQRKRSPDEMIAALRQQLSLEDNVVCYSVYNEVHSVIQEGPQCGLVALCMAAQLLQCVQPEVDAVVHTARCMGFTKQGEMFSASNMCALACKLLNCRGQVLSSSMDWLMKLLSHRAAALLVPYDKDRNHTPCNKRGLSAHWALVSGAVALAPRQPGSTSLLQEVAGKRKQEVAGALSVSASGGGGETEETQAITAASGNSNENNEHDDTLLYHLQQPLSTEEATALCSLRHVYVYANQGKSIHTHLWNVDELTQSNQQLVELDPEITTSQGDYQVGDGIRSGLCGQAVFLWTD